MTDAHGKIRCKPEWLRAPLPGGARYRQVKAAVTGNLLATVCSEARCPNLGECWNSGTATFMILGKVCTRGCRFCAVARGTGEPLDGKEPERVANAVTAMALDYVVVTSVTRDDLADGGAGQFAGTIGAIRKQNPRMPVEVLTPDFQGDALNAVLNAAPTVFAHNIETVERISPSMRHQRFDYTKSLKTLQVASGRAQNVITKSSLMLGLGETAQEVRNSMVHLRDAGVKILVLGQYLQPTRDHEAVTAYIDPSLFNEYQIAGIEMGFEFVAAAPLARTSYKAAEAYVRSRHEN